MLRNYVRLSRDGSDPTLRLDIVCGFTNNWKAYPNPIVNGQWRHVCAVNQQTQWSLYDNGEFVTSLDACSLSSFPLTSNLIGKGNRVGDGLLVGKISEFRIYQRALSSIEVASIYFYKGKIMLMSFFLKGQRRMY